MGASPRDGQIVGTGDYMAPEQVARARQADIRADIYGLGATLFHIITGTVPLGGGTLLKTYMNRLENEPPRLSSLIDNVPRGLDSVVAKMLKTSPEERYQTPDEVAADLAGVLAGTATDAPRQTSPSQVPSSHLPELISAAPIRAECRPDVSAQVVRPGRFLLGRDDQRFGKQLGGRELGRHGDRRFGPRIHPPGKRDYLEPPGRRSSARHRRPPLRAAFAASQAEPHVPSATG